MEFYQAALISIVSLSVGILLGYTFFNKNPLETHYQDQLKLTNQFADLSAQLMGRNFTAPVEEQVPEDEKEIEEAIQQEFSGMSGGAN